MPVLLVVLMLLFAAPASATQRSAYALPTGSAEAAAHPDWILRDNLGNPLYLGTDYAADFGNPAYRAWWIAQVAGSQALYVDDVVMERRVRTVAGVAAVPRDPRTTFAMSESTWQRYMADFMVEVRTALPAAEIVHDVEWTKGWAATHVQRQLNAADHVALERGFNDPAIVFGTSRFGWQSLAAFIEAQQAAGRGVLVDDGAGTAYGRATALLLDRGALTVTGSGASLGTPLTGRYAWFGVWRRDFTGGIVLVNEPGALTRTLTLPAGYSASSVTLTAGTASVLAKVPPAPPAPVADVPPAPPAPVKTPTPPRTGTKKRRGGPATAHTAGARGPRDTTTTASLAGTRVYGRVRGAVNGTVRVAVERKRGNRWSTVRRTSATVSRRGAYARDIARLPRGPYRVSARFLGTGTARPSQSRPRRERI
jgi:Hypothetical glycosyl hydrolase family 15